MSQQQPKHVDAHQAAFGKAMPPRADRSRDAPGGIILVQPASAYYDPRGQLPHRPDGNLQELAGACADAGDAGQTSLLLIANI